MATPAQSAFDGSAYRKDVLSTLRDRSPSEVEDLFWLAHIPRELDDDDSIRERLSAAKGFLNKELSRARQAAVASAVLKEWPRVEQALTDTASRRALRDRLDRTPDAPAQPAVPRRRTAPQSDDPVARRRRQVAASLRELARLRGEPELAEDLFALLGLPVTATPATIEERLAKIGEVNRRRRADRERSLTDELLAQARELLVVGDPATYMAGLAADAAGGVADALLVGDVPGAREALAVAREGGSTDAAVLAQLAKPARERAAGGGAPLPTSAAGLGTWCPACGTINAAGAQTCAGCGGGLTVQCADCRTVSPADLTRCPSCGADLAAVRAKLVDGRTERDAARAAQHAPPSPVARVAVTRTEDGAVLAWPASDDPRVDAYLVERAAGGTTRVLGRTALTTWTDSSAVVPGVSWSVRALRGERASEPVATGSGPPPSSAKPEAASTPGPAPAAETAPGPDAARPPGALIEGVRVARAADGRLQVTWDWPAGTTEAYVAWASSPPQTGGEQGRKVTNMRYELDGGAFLDGVPAGVHIAVFAGRRDPSGVLTWGSAHTTSRVTVP